MLIRLMLRACASSSSEAGYLPGERKKNYLAPQRLSIKLQSVHKERHITFSDRQRSFPSGLSVERRLHTCYFLYLPCPGGGMADAEDLKSSVVVWVSPVLSIIFNLE
jgi:hypothetical protein